MNLLDLPGVGEKVLVNLESMGIKNLEDLLFYLPKAYQDRTRVCLISDLLENKECVIDAEILNSKILFGRRRMLICEVDDGSGLLTLRFFYFNQAQQTQMQKGRRIRLFGTAKRYQFHFEMIHPEYKIYLEDQEIPLETSLTPVYALPEGLGLSQGKFRAWIKTAFENISPENIQELLPLEIKKIFNLPNLYEALKFMHSPTLGTQVDKIIQGDHPMIHRLIFEELLAHSLLLLQVKSKIKKEPAPICHLTEKTKKLFFKNIPFKPTQAQSRVLAEISEDLKTPHPMLRLLQGDVGSGKTWVAALSALTVIESGCQVALMAPTEILAEQHAKTFQKWFGPLNIQSVLLTSKQTAKFRREAQAKIAQGEIGLIIGTQALFQESVSFAKLGLVIVDEQHRFGVLQRKALLEKNTGPEKPHQLIMTATPIPRTLAMTVYADLDVSIIDELPPGRIPIQTVLIDSRRRAEIIARLKNYIQSGQQIYWVCTLIEESENFDSEAAVLSYEKLSQELPELKIGLIHGKLKQAEKQTIMGLFSAGEINILVATTVIEVGVDVPNASMMVIENPERLGLSQLHQLRGRVGRGSQASFCVLLYQQPLSQSAQARLEAMRLTTDGFVLAEKDLELRGPGEFLGTRQTGEMSFRFANIARDRTWLPKIHEAALKIWTDYPETIQPLIYRWLKENQRLAEV